MQVHIFTNKTSHSFVLLNITTSILLSIIFYTHFPAFRVSPICANTRKPQRSNTPVDSNFRFITYPSSHPRHLHRYPEILSARFDRPKRFPTIVCPPTGNLSIPRPAARKPTVEFHGIDAFRQSMYKTLLSIRDFVLLYIFLAETRLSLYLPLSR